MYTRECLGQTVPRSPSLLLSRLYLSLLMCLHLLSSLLVCLSVSSVSLLTLSNDFLSLLIFIFSLLSALSVSVLDDYDDVDETFRKGPAAQEEPQDKAETS